MMDALLNLTAQMAREGIRRLLVLSGDESWTLQQAQALRERLGGDGLWVGPEPVSAPCVAPGALKTLLDLLPERALEGKIVLPLATGGTIAHMLAVDYALKPVLNALKAQEILHGVFADDSQVTDYQHKPQFTANLQRRLDDALETFWQALHRPSSRAPSLTSLRGVEHA